MPSSKKKSFQEKLLAAPVAQEGEPSAPAAHEDEPSPFDGFTLITSSGRSLNAAAGTLAESTRSESIKLESMSPKGSTEKDSEFQHLLSLISNVCSVISLPLVLIETSTKKTFGDIHMLKVSI